MSMRSFESTSYSPSRVPSEGESETTTESVSVIDRFSNFDGTYHSTRDLRIEGQVKGTIDCQGTLHIAQGANVDARIEAENISVAGDLDGDISCRGRLQILPSGRVRGKINTVTLVINEGAFYEGELEMGGPERTATRRASRTRNGSASVPTPISSTSEGTESGSEEAAPATGDGNTFIRRFGGQETAWDDTNGPPNGDPESPNS